MFNLCLTNSFLWNGGCTVVISREIQSKEENETQWWSVKRASGRTKEHILPVQSNVLQQRDELIHRTAQTRPSKRQRHGKLEKKRM